MPRVAVLRIASVITALTFLFVVASPFVAFALLKSGVENNAAYARLLMEATEREWRQATDKPLRMIAGPFGLVSTAAFYGQDRPSTFAHFSKYLSPWADDARLAPRRDGDHVRRHAALPSVHRRGRGALRRREPPRRRDACARLARIQERARALHHRDRAAAMSSLLKPFERLLDALTGPRRERNVVWLLVGYCAIWSLYGALAKGSQDVHFDMGEMVAWSRDAGIGTPKHPPLAAWLVRAWFTVFPLADWSYYVFAMVLTTFALWVAWRVSERTLDAEKRIAGLLLLTFIPFFNFHALKFNANTVLIPLWALTTWFFLRSFETRNAMWAALAGAAAAAAMLGKYWSVFLLLGLGVAALADPRRARYFKSPAPWITVAVGAILFAPHVAWIVANDFAPFTYAVVAHQSTLARSALSGLGFLMGVAGYLAAPVAISAAIMRPSLEGSPTPCGRARPSAASR